MPEGAAVAGRDNSGVVLPPGAALCATESPAGRNGGVRERHPGSAERKLADAVDLGTAGDQLRCAQRKKGFMPKCNFNLNIILLVHL